MRAIKQDEKNEIRLYLLGQLDETSEERIELRLFTEPTFIEEFDTIVDEITDEYVRGEITGDERGRLEQYFLKAKERRFKTRFAAALIEHAAATRGNKADPVKTPTLFERLAAFLSPQSMAFKLASTTAVVLLAVSITFVAYRGWSTPQTYASIQLSASSSERGENAPPAERLKLAPETDAVKLILNLPDGSPQYQSYTVELTSQRDGVKTSLKVAEQTQRTVTAEAPVSLLKSGRYAILLMGVKADGTMGRVPGTYSLTIE